MDNTLTKNLILKNKKDINGLFNSGKWKRGKYINLVSHENKEIKILFATSRYVKLASGRNRYKRYLREIFRKNKNLFSKDTHYGLILKSVSSSNIETMLLKDLKNLLR